MSELRLADEQRHPVERHDEHCLLAAGAGSGKTRVLVERYLRILADAGWDPRLPARILAVTFTDKAALEMRGRILDAATDQGIAGVSFILISDLYSVADFMETRNMDQVYALAVTDREGRFQIDRMLSYDAPYSVIVLADGYMPIQADGVTIEQDTPLPIDMTIYLSKG